MGTKNWRGKMTKMVYSNKSGVVWVFKMCEARDEHSIPYLLKEFPKWLREGEK